MHWSNKFNRTGLTLIEFIIGFAIFVIVSVALYALLKNTFIILNDDQNRSAAVGIARQQMEYIKNLPYDDVGTTGGVPGGNIPQEQTQLLNNVTYTITTNIKYIDDDFDGITPTDVINIDYKKVRIKVTWDQGNDTTPVELYTNIVPTQIEEQATGGTLWIEVHDPTTDPVSPIKNATVVITAPTVNPPVNTTGETDDDGRFILPGVPAGIEAYHVVVTKQDYSSDQTYTLDAITNPNPTPPDLNIINGEVTTQYFEISKKVNLLAVHLQNYDSNANVIAPFQIHGAKTMGTDLSGLPLYQYNQTITPNDGGNAEIHNLENDAYSIVFDEASIGYVLAGYDHQLPYIAAAQSSQTIMMYLATYEPYTALLNINNQSNALVAGASVQLANGTGTYDQTQLTTSSGQVFFRGLQPGIYTMTITASGYTTYSNNVIVNGNEQQTFSITAN